MFNDIIELLLHKKAKLREEIEREFAVRAVKIDELLKLAGYVETVEVADEIVNVEQPVEQPVEQSVEQTIELTTADPLNY